MGSTLDDARGRRASAALVRCFLNWMPPECEVLIELVIDGSDVAVVELIIVLVQSGKYCPLLSCKSYVAKADGIFGRIINPM